MDDLTEVRRFRLQQVYEMLQAAGQSGLIVREVADGLGGVSKNYAKQLLMQGHEWGWFRYETRLEQSERALQPRSRWWVNG